ncbi:MAG TPA: 4-(cytidine 5'-diphospho)-2-C-methyl-D-erythritol kinase [Novimethylophilus sp.]|jgi:4-diphosphocytidyl-2-C-methyl-D-erythritol kinase|uniref:4-(cytidine 5'-diphospho)-2-C-methyl-D-erythritol kinase n=1 Tax=Novimethylophilus sp. TaxID=2137426 RepID=UPI002F41FE3E
MQAFPAPAKLNLFLHVTGRRADGFHLLQTVFRLLDHGDTVHLGVRQDGEIRRTNEVAGVPENDDLTVRAARLLQKTSGYRLGADIKVEKRIPMGGGLGGGSSDAATVLLALNRLWQLDLPRQRLMELGLQLGADVPVFVFGRNAWGEGIGEQLQAIALEPACYAVLTPPVHVSTPAIFASQELTRNTIPRTMAAFSRGFGHNDLESVVCRMHPEVASCLNWLKQFGDARMSGSGASVFVELPSLEAAERVVAARPNGVSGFAARGLEHHPLHGNAK